MSRPTTGLLPSGLRHATTGAWRVVAYANGGYFRQTRSGADWRLCRDGEMPWHTERSLLASLGMATPVPAAVDQLRHSDDSTASLAYADWLEEEGAPPLECLRWRLYGLWTRALAEFLSRRGALWLDLPLEGLPRPSRVFVRPRTVVWTVEFGLDVQLARKCVDRPGTGPGSGARYLRDAVRRAVDTFLCPDEFLRSLRTCREGT